MENQITFNEESKSFKVVIIVLLSMFIAGFTLWLLLYPVSKYSAVFWVGAVLMAIPGYVAAESLGSLGLGANFVKKLPKVVRILFGVFWVLICLFIYSLVLGFLSSLVNA